MDEYTDPRDIRKALERAQAQDRVQPVSYGANSRQVGGNHYKTGGEEHWDRVNRLQLDYFQGQITRYVERWKLKNGIEDLKKARHFLDKYIEIEECKPQPVQAMKVADSIKGSISAGEPDKRYVDQ